jgi:hypothetical protein
MKLEVFSRLRYKRGISEMNNKGDFYVLQLAVGTSA